MAKQITATVETYEKDGETKYKNVDIGVLMSGDHGDYILLNPTVDLSGVLMRQRILGKKGSSVMCNIWDEKPKQQGQQGGFDDDLPPF